MKVLHLHSLGSLRSSETEPAGSIRLSSGVQSLERLQEERHPGAPCHVSSDDVWSVAINGYETTRS